MPSDCAASFIRATNRSVEPASQRARTAAMLFAEAATAPAAPAAPSTARRPRSTRPTLVPLATVGVRDIVVGERDHRAVLAGRQRVVSKHEIRGHHLGDAGDRSRMLVGADLNRRLPDANGGLASFGPHSPWQCRAILCAQNVGGPCGRRRRNKPPLADHGDRRNDDEQAEDTGLADPNRTSGRSCVRAVTHAAIQGTAALRGRIRFSICPRNVARSSICACAC